MLQGLSRRSRSPVDSVVSTKCSRSAGSSRDGSSRWKYPASSSRAESSQLPTPPGSPATSSASSGWDSSRVSHCGSTRSTDATSVRSGRGRSNSRSRTACTTVPRAACALGRSGSRSIVRKRNSSGQVMKSAARDGDSEGTSGSSGEQSAAAAVQSTSGSPASCSTRECTGWSAVVVMAPTINGSSDRIREATPDWGYSACRPPTHRTRSIVSMTGSTPSPPRSRGSGLSLGRPFGIPVFVSPSWFLVAAYITFSFGVVVDRQVGDLGPLRYAVSAGFAVLIFLSILGHELGHCVVSRAFGLPVRRLTIFLLGGLSEIEREPETPSRDYLVAVVGPLVSLLIAGVSFVVAHALPPDGVARLLLGFTAWSNLLVAGFNLLPGLPLAGGRACRPEPWPGARCSCPATSPCPKRCARPTKSAPAASSSSTASAGHMGWSPSRRWRLRRCSGGRGCRSVRWPGCWTLV